MSLMSPAPIKPAAKTPKPTEKRAASDDNMFREAIRRPKKQIIKKKKSEENHRNGVWDLQAFYV